jgi:hypothetical protein
MKNDVYWNALLSAALVLVIAGCATQGGPASETPTAAVAEPHVAMGPAVAPKATQDATHASAGVATAPSAAAANGLPDMAASAPLGGSTASQSAVTKAQLPAPSAEEVRTGVQVAQIGMAAGGGLVDLRLKVLDAAKASKLLGNPANVPMLIAGDTPPLQPPHHALRGARFGNGLIFYILYPNARGAVKPGSEVVVAMGDVRLGPVTVR